MSYIGLPPKATFSSGLLDRFTSTTGTTVTLTHDIASENDIVVFVNFVKQDSTTYSVGGTGNKTLTLGGTLVSSDIVEVHYLNIVGQTVNPSANSVGSSQLTADSITGQSAETSIATDDTILIHDTSASALKKMTRANFVSGVGGTSIVNTWYLSSNINPVPTTNSNVLITAFTEYTSAPYAKVGSSMSNSSGIWTFPETGIYKISSTLQFEEYGNAYSGKNGIIIEATTDNSSYSTADLKFSWLDGSAGGACHGFVDLDLIIDVTSTSNVKVKFFYFSQATTIINGGSANKSKITFEKIGNT